MNMQFITYTIQVHVTVIVEYSGGKWWSGNVLQSYATFGQLRAHFWPETRSQIDSQNCVRLFDVLFMLYLYRIYYTYEYIGTGKSASHCLEDKGEPPNLGVPLPSSRLFIERIPENC